MKAMLAWRLDARMAQLADRPRAPAAIFRVPPGYAGEPAAPAIPGQGGFTPVARAGAWTLVAACRRGR
jgi:hypothetical protein